MLSYTFDDGHISTYTQAFPALKQYQKVGVIGVVSDWSFPPQDSRTNITQLLELQSAGWEITSHSVSHPDYNKIPQTYTAASLQNWSKVSGTPQTYVTKYPYTQLPFILENGARLKSQPSLTQVNKISGSYYFNAEKNSSTCMAQVVHILIAPIYKPIRLNMNCKHQKICLINLV